MSNPRYPEGKSLTGLITIEADEVYSEYYQDVSSQNIVYLNGLQGNVQNQIDVINSQIANGGGGGGGYFLIWAESTNGFSTLNSGYQWSFGANGQNATNTPLVLGFPCNLIRFAIRTSSIPSTAATIQILKNGSVYYQVSGINSTAFTVDLSGSNLYYNSTDSISIVTLSGSGGGLLRISLSFSSVGVQGPTGQGLTYKGDYSSSISYVPYDFVYYNGSSYICTIACTGISPSNSSFWGLMAVQGEPGQRGATGPKGDTGDTGPRGPEGPKGDKGDAGESIGIAAILAGIAEFVISAAAFAALQAEVTALSASVAIAQENILVLQGKTQNQTAVIGSTSFSGNVNISNGVSNRIILNSTGTIEGDDLTLTNAISCKDINSDGSISSNGVTVYGPINSTGNITVSDASLVINKSGAVFTPITMDSSGNINTQGSINVNSGLVTGVSIDSNGITSGSVTCTTALNASTIMPSNSTNSIIIGSPTVPGTITLWGYVYMPFNNLSIGPGGFFNQFPQG